VTLHSQRGTTLLEAVVVSAICAVVLGGVLFALTTVSRHVARQAGPHRTAAIVLAQQTLRIAQDAWKYGALATPSGTQPLALPGTLTASVSSNQLTVTVTYTPDPGHDDSGSVSLTGPLMPKAPLPGTQVDRPGRIAQPSGAP
jgi:type II secretory pathway pseudopilin PulG